VSTPPKVPDLSYQQLCRRIEQLLIHEGDYYISDGYKDAVSILKIRDGGDGKLDLTLDNGQGFTIDVDSV
jgi:hypothetical protein